MKRLIILLSATAFLLTAQSVLADLLTTFAGSGTVSSGPPPTCAGVIDLSVGCIIP